MQIEFIRLAKQLLFILRTNYFEIFLNLTIAIKVIKLSLYSFNVSKLFEIRCSSVRSKFKDESVWSTI